MSLFFNLDNVHRVDGALRKLLCLWYIYFVLEEIRWITTAKTLRSSVVLAIVLVCAVLQAQRGDPPGELRKLHKRGGVV